MRAPQLLTPDVVRGAAERVRRSIHELLGVDIDVDVVYGEALSPELGVSRACQEYDADEVVAAFSKVSAKGLDQEYYMVLLADVETAKNLALILSGEAGLELDEELAMDIIREFTNIVFGALTAEASRARNLRVDYTIPEVTIDLCLAVLSELAASCSVENPIVELHQIRARAHNAHLSLGIVAMGGAYA